MNELQKNIPQNLKEVERLIDKYPELFSILLCLLFFVIYININMDTENSMDKLTADEMHRVYTDLLNSRVNINDLNTNNQTILGSGSGSIIEYYSHNWLITAEHVIRMYENHSDLLFEDNRGREAIHLERRSISCRRSPGFNDGLDGFCFSRLNTQNDSVIPLSTTEYRLRLDDQSIIPTGSVVAYVNRNGKLIIGETVRHELNGNNILRFRVTDNGQYNQTCSGDSGSVLLVRTNSGNWEIAGVISRIHNIPPSIISRERSCSTEVTALGFVPNQEPPAS